MAVHGWSSLSSKMQAAWSRSKMMAGGIRHNPFIVILPCIAMCACMGLGVWAVFYAAGQEASNNKDAARQQVALAANTLHMGFNAAVLPLIQAATTAKHVPDYSTLMSMLPEWSEDWWAQAPAGAGVQRVSPFGRVAYVIPAARTNMSGLGVDLLGDPIERPYALEAVAARNATPAGPYMYRGAYTLFVRMPIFVPNTTENQTWGVPWKQATDCPRELCWVPETQSKFWGFTAMGLNWDQFMNWSGSPLASVATSGLKYRLLRPAHEAVEPLGWHVVQTNIDEQANPSSDAVVTVDINILGRMWLLEAWQDSWEPVYKAPLIAVVVVCSVVCGVLLFLVLFTRAEHQALLRSLLPQSAIDHALERLRWSTEKDDDAALQMLMQGTPAEAIMGMVAECLQGKVPGLPQVSIVRNALKAGADIYRPLTEDISNRMAHHDKMDNEVKAALMAQLLGKDATKEVKHLMEEDEELAEISGIPAASPATIGREEVDPQQVLAAVAQAPDAMTEPAFTQASPDDPYSSLESGLSAITGVPVPVPINDPNNADIVCGLGGAQTSQRQRDRASTGMWRTSLSNYAPSRSSPVRYPLAKFDRASCTNLPPPVHRLSGSGAATAVDAPMSPLKVVGPRTSLPHRSARPSPVGDALLPAGAGDVHPDKPLFTQLETVLHTAHQWTFDVFALDEASNGRPLSSLGFWLFYQSGLIEQLHLHPSRLARFLMAVEDGYLDNPYHNRRHAADVLQTMHVLLFRGGLVPGYADESSVLGCYLAAVVHDFEHVGRNNDFLVVTQHELALRYNDRSPMENHHLAAAWTLLKQDDMNFVKKLSKAAWARLRKLVVDMVLATDMKQHFGLVGQFSALHRLADSGPEAISHSPSIKPVSAAGAPSETEMSSSHGGTLSGQSQTGSELVYTPVSDADQLLSLQIAMKVADVGHLTAQRPVHLKWVAALEEEFFLQGDAERALGLPISPLCDRTKQGVMKSQVGFIEFVIIPLYTNYVHRFGLAKPLYKLMKANYRYWQAQAEAQPSQPDKDAAKAPRHASK